MSGVAVTAPASRPPLPPKPRAPSRSRKQREREVPDVDWEASLQHFAAAVSGDLDELQAKFLQQDEVTFAVWKRLWADARMSAAFHVEFWESSPTNTHKTILQQALDALVFCIEERDGEFESSTGVAALAGRVFALYCAYSVQLGQPKHKIDVDPRSWTALLTINCVMGGAGKTLHPTAAQEVRAMMLRLVVEENAFLRCLQGFGPSVRVKEQPAKARDADVASVRSLSLAGDATEGNYAPVQANTVELLKSLDGHYQQLMSRARSAETSVAGGRRGKAALSSKLLSTQEAGNDAQELTRALTSYMEYKASEETRRNDRVARAAAVRESESQTRPEQTSSERDDCSNILDLSDRGSVLSAPPSPVVPTAVSTGYGSHTRRNSGDSEDFLAELETELNAGVSSGVAEAIAAPTSPNKQSSSFSEISEADSDALADLEQELEQSAELVPSRAKEKALPARRKRDREPPVTGIVPRKSPRVTASTQAATPNFTNDIARPTAKRARNNSVPSRLSLARSWTATSAADSDGLADVQAELDAIPTLSVPAEASGAAIQSTSSLPRSALSSVVSEADSDALEDLERELNATAATLGLAAQPPIASINGKQRTVDKPTQRPTRRNVGKQRLKAVVARVSAPVQPTAQTTSRGTSKQRAVPRESTGIGSVSSDTESDGLAELVAELGASVAAQLNPPVQRSKKSPAKTTKRSSATRKRTPKAVAPRPVLSKAPNRSASGLRRSARLSSVASDTESDGLEDLLAELQSTPKTLPVNSKKAKARAATKTTAKSKPKTARTPRAPRQKQAKSKLSAAGNTVCSPQSAPRVNLPSSRRSTRSSSTVKTNKRSTF